MAEDLDNSAKIVLLQFIKEATKMRGKKFT